MNKYGVITLIGAAVILGQSCIISGPVSYLFDSVESHYSRGRPSPPRIERIRGREASVVPGALEREKLSYDDIERR